MIEVGDPIHPPCLPPIDVARYGGHYPPGLMKTIYWNVIGLGNLDTRLPVLKIVVLLKKILYAVEIE